MRKTQTIITIVLMLLWVNGSLIAGSLEPTAAPGPTMKTLSEVEPRTPIPAGSFGSSYTISNPGSYYLAGNRTLTVGIPGIIINASNVTIDLNGFALTGTGSGGIANGIKINSGYGNIEIRNGTITLFGNCGVTSPSANSDVRINNVRLILNRSYGIELLGISNMIENCLIAENEDKGISAGSNSTVSGCVVHDNNDMGIYIQSGSVITGCSSYGNNSDGIFAFGAVIISNNSCYGNGGDGIYAFDGEVTIIGNTVKNNGLRGICTSGASVVKDNLAAFNANAGFQLSAGSTVINNTARNNTANGFLIDSGSTVIGNSSYSNGNFGFSINPNCLVDQNTAYDNNQSGGGYANISACVTCTFGLNHAP